MSVNIYFGKTGSGKSFLANKIINQYDKKIIFDPTPTKNFSGEFETSDYSVGNFIRIIKKFAGKQKFSIIFRPSERFSMHEQGERVALFAMQLGKAFKSLNGEYSQIAVVFDELDKYVSMKQDAWIGRLAGMGRHYHCHLHCITQVPAKMPKSIRDNAYNVHAFPLAKNDFYKEKFGDAITEFLASEKCPKFHHFLWNDGKGVKFLDEKLGVVDAKVG